MKAVIIRVYGRVHHVGYRFTAMQIAYQLDIKGFIENKKDGSLYIEAEGEDESIQKFIEWCNKGPIWSKVDRISLDDNEIKNYSGFDIH